MVVNFSLVYTHACQFFTILSCWLRGTQCTTKRYIIYHTPTTSGNNQMQILSIMCTGWDQNIISINTWSSSKEIYINRTDTALNTAHYKILRKIYKKIDKTKYVVLIKFSIFLFIQKYTLLNIWIYTVIKIAFGFNCQYVYILFILLQFAVLSDCPNCSWCYCCYCCCNTCVLFVIIIILPFFCAPPTSLQMVHKWFVLDERKRQYK